MQRFLRLLALLIIISYAIQCEAEICKWVDEDGVPHFAENCPDDEKGSLIDTDSGPTPEEVAAAELRSISLREATAARRAQLAREQEEALQADLSTDASADAAIQKCADARVKLQVLRKTLPVYYDQAYQLHYNRSLHDRWYQGSRSYLDDQQRQTEILKYAQVEADNCTADPADIRERIRIYMQMHDQEVCQMLRNRLQALRGRNTGIPTSEMRDLQDQIESGCK